MKQWSELLAGSWLKSSGVAEIGVGVTSPALKEDWNGRQGRGQGRWSWDDETDNSGGDAAASGAYRGCSGAPCRSEKETGRGGLSCRGVMSVSSVGTHSPSLNSTSAVYSFAATVEIT